MNTKIHKEKQSPYQATKDARTQLLAGISISEHRLRLAGVSTAILEGGSGPPIILLHGPGESSLWWMRVIPKLVTTHRVIIPDLPGHGASEVTGGPLDSERVFNWLSELIERTCPSPPTLTGNILGGSIAARFSINHGKRVSRLVLVNSLGLGKFRPAPGFAFGLFRFMLWPTQKNFNRFLPQCMYDVGDLRRQMGKYWEPFLAYNLECARDPERKANLRILMKHLGVPKIPSEELARIDVPTALIWGRHDRANKLQIAEAASESYGWPLHVIEKTRDDPKLERPKAFVRVLNNILSENRKHDLKHRQQGEKL